MSDESIECLCGLSFSHNSNCIMNISCIILKIYFVDNKLSKKTEEALRKTCKFKCYF